MQHEKDKPRAELRRPSVLAQDRSLVSSAIAKVRGNQVDRIKRQDSLSVIRSYANDAAALVVSRDMAASLSSHSETTYFVDEQNRAKGWLCANVGPKVAVYNCYELLKAENSRVADQDDLIRLVEDFWRAFPDLSEQPGPDQASLVGAASLAMAVGT